MKGARHSELMKARLGEVPQSATARFKLCRFGVYTVLPFYFPARKLASVFADTGFRTVVCKVRRGPEGVNQQGVDRVVNLNLVAAF